MSVIAPPIKEGQPTKIKVATTGWQGLNYSGIQAWTILAAGGVGTGAIWRWLGTGPNVFQLLDGLGIAYWLVPLLLVHNWEFMRGRQLVHFSRGLHVLVVATRNSLRMLGYLLAISLAPLGFFLAYNDLNPAAHIMTDLFDFNVGYGGFVFLVLALFGTIILFLSLVSLVVARRFVGSHNGTVLWILVGIGLNVSIVTGSKVGAAYLSLGGFAVVARASLNRGLLDPARISYLDELAKAAFGIPLALLLGVLLLSVLVQLPQQNTRERLGPFWVSGLVGIVLPAIFAQSHASQWIGNLSKAYPWVWDDLFLVGLIPMLALYSLLSWQVGPTVQPKGDFMGLVFMSLCPVSWVCFSIPVIQAGQVAKPQLALGCIISILLIWVWVALVQIVSKARKTNPVFSGVLMAALIAIPVMPITGSNHSGLAALFVYLASFFSGSQLL